MLGEVGVTPGRWMSVSSRAFSTDGASPAHTGCPDSEATESKCRLPLPLPPHLLTPGWVQLAGLAVSAWRSLTFPGGASTVFCRHTADLAVQQSYSKLQREEKEAHSEVPAAWWARDAVLLGRAQLQHFHFFPHH